MLKYIICKQCKIRKMAHVMLDGVCEKCRYPLPEYKNKYVARKYYGKKQDKVLDIS